MLQSLNHFLWPFAGVSLVCPSPTCTEEPRTRPSALEVSHQGWVKLKDHLNWPAGNICLMQPRMVLDFFGLRLHLQLMFSLTSRPAKFFSAKVLPVLVHGVIPPQVQDYVHCPISCIGTFLQPLEFSLNGSTTIWFTSHSSAISVSCWGCTLSHYVDY